MQKYLPFINSGILSSLLFSVMTDYCISDVIFDLNVTVFYIMPVFVSVISAVILYKAIIKSSGKAGWGVLINALVFNVTNILYLVLPIKIFTDTAGDDPGNLLFMFAWMIYFPAVLLADGVAMMCAEKKNVILTKK